MFEDIIGEEKVRGPDRPSITKHNIKGPVMAFYTEKKYSTENGLRRCDVSVRSVAVTCKEDVENIEAKEDFDDWISRPEYLAIQRIAQKRYMER